MGHITPGVERLDVRADDCIGAVRPAELGSRLAQPDLQGLRTDRLGTAEHAREALVLTSRGDPAADLRQGTDRYPKDDRIETLPAFEGQGRALGRVRVELEFDRILLEPLALLKLCPQRLAGPASDLFMDEQRAVP